MTGGRCHRRKKMKEVRGEEAEEERPCPDSRVPATIPTNSPENSSAKDVDFLAQARKALSLRSPCDGSDEASLAAVPILPSALAGFLSSQSDSRKKHKKAHSSAGMNMKKNSSSSKSRAPSVWDMNEDYFRDLTMQDIESLSEVSELISGSAASRKCLWIPSVSEGNEDNCGNGNEVAFENDFATTVLDEAVEKVVENGALAEEEAKKEEDGQSMEIDHVEIEGLPRKDRGPTVSEPYRGLEWLLGVRNKVSLTSERPSKKRKLLGVEAGLEKALVACPCDGISSLCHFCSAGNEGSELSRLISCSSCGVSVHRKCYGVQEDNADSSWLCSWCKTKTTESGRDSEYPCVLCPKKGGALKPVSLTDEKDKSLGFAHLFCSQWAPEAYVEDLEKMEPILNVEAVKEVRKKIICNICKVKFGACVRCSHGACRSAFHPLCAREARYRMEVWGRYGCDDVELRAFCLKHSEVQDQSNTSRAGDSLVAGSNPDSVDSLPEKNVGCRNGDDSEVHVVAPGSISDKSSDSDLQGTSLADSRFNDGELGSTDEDISAADLYNFALIFKKLVDRGRIKIEDVASQIGTSEDLLSASLADDTIASDLQLKIARWLKKNVHLSTVQNNRKIGTRSKVSSKAESGAADDSNVVSVSESDIADNVPVKSVTPRRRTKSGARISNDPKLISSAQDREIFSDKESAPSEKADKLVNREQDELSEISTCHAVEQNIAEPEASQVTPAHRNGAGSMAEPSHTIPQEKCQVERLSAPKQDSFSEADGNPTCSVANPVCPNLQTMEMEGASNFYIHPDIQKKLLQMKDGVDLSSHMDGLVEEHRVSLDGLNKHLICDEMRSSTDVSKELAKATESGILELAPEDELEGEIVYFQNKFLSNAASRKTLSDKLISSVAKSLPQELDLARDNSWDSVLVNKYLGELREAKKQGRKERRHKEAQAVLAAATAAAAASSRISSLRKDGDDVSNPESTSGRFGNYSQPIPRAKETLQRVAAPRISLEKHSDSTQSIVDISKEHPRACDICRRSDSLLNPILVCCGCKVAVHLDCYRSVKESTGPWYCELCEELLMSRSSGAPAVNFWEKPYFVAECGLCGGSTGAFRKTSDGQWVHAFCAEWVFESKFRRGQINSVEGMEAVSKAVDLCLICRRRHGVCIKCNYGHCQASFHPWCARSAGFFMNIKSSASKQQHKAYCEKHSVEQRAKAESQKHGAEELKSLKQVRVELERLRLLCERLIKREKLKRELVLCSHDILAMRRDHVARSTLSRRPYLLPDVSSESVTTSLKGHTDDRKSCSEALQRSDDVTVDSTVSVKRRGRASGAMDDRRTEDDCSTPQNQSTTRKTTDRSKFSGKQIPNRPSSVATRNLMDESWKSKVKKQETFGKEMVMTSDQASVKNMLLPKGYAYVPADCLSNEKQQPNQDPGSGEPSDHGG